MKRLSTTLFGLAFLGITVTASYFYGSNSSAGRKLKAETRIGNINDTGKQSPAQFDSASLCQQNMTWVTLNQAIVKVRAYGAHQWTGINQRMNADYPVLNPIGRYADSRFVTFPVDTIKKFICKIEQMVAGYENKKPDGSPILPSDLGVRFYYVTNPVTNARNVQNGESYEGRHTLLLVPTYMITEKGDNRRYIEFFPSYVDPDTKIPLPLGVVPKAPVAGRPHTMMALNDREAGKNQGTLCPPPDSCSGELLMMSGYRRPGQNPPRQ